MFTKILYFSYLIRVLVAIDTNIFHTNFLKREDALFKKCIYNIVSKENPSNIFISNQKRNMPNYLFTGNFPVIIYEDSFIIFNEVHLSEKFNMYLLLLTNKKIAIMLLNNLKSSEVWNSRGKFIIIIKQNFLLIELFDILWKYYIYNVIVIIENNWEMYTYYFYNTSYSAIIGNCLNPMIDGDASYFPEKDKNLKDYSVRLLSFRRPPFVLNSDESSSSDNPLKQGFENTIINAITSKLNLRKIYVNNPFTDWGTKLKNGSYTKMYKMIIYNEADLMFGGTYASSHYLNDFDNFMCHGIYKGFWWVPVAQEIPKWQNFLKLFNIKVWFSIFASIFINGILFWIINLFVFSKTRNALIFYLLKSLSILLQISVQFPKNKHLKTVFFIWSFGSLLIFTAYQSQLISVLTNPIFEKQIETMQDILDAKLKYGFHDSVVPFYNMSISVEREILTNYVYCDLGIDCMNRTAFMRDFATMKNSKQIEYFIPRYWTFSNGRKMIYGVNDFSWRSLAW